MSVSMYPPIANPPNATDKEKECAFDRYYEYFQCYYNLYQQWLAGEITLQQFQDGNNACYTIYAGAWVQCYVSA